MEQRKISDNASCFLIKDDRLKKDWNLSPIYHFLKKEGFIAQSGSSSIEGINWLYVNIYSKVFAKGRGGIALAQVVGNHAITFEEFVTIYNIYKKYDGFNMLIMNKAEQAAFDEKFPLEKMKRIIGCDVLTHEVLHNYTRTGWWTREMLPWEHCGKRFQPIAVPMRTAFLSSGIHYCRYKDEPYYFGLGLDEPDVTDDMLENGTWLVYTWSD